MTVCRGSRDRFIGASRIDYLDASVRPDIDLTTNFYNTPPDNISEYHDTTTLILDFGYDGYPRKGSQRVSPCASNASLCLGWRDSLDSGLVFSDPKGTYIPARGNIPANLALVRSVHCPRQP